MIQFVYQKHNSPIALWRMARQNRGNVAMRKYDISEEVGKKEPEMDTSTDTCVQRSEEKAQGTGKTTGYVRFSHDDLILPLKSFHKGKQRNEKQFKGNVVFKGVYKHKKCQIAFSYCFSNNLYIKKQELKKTT